jgi:hypothetical protein
MGRKSIGKKKKIPRLSQSIIPPERATRWYNSLESTNDDESAILMALMDAWCLYVEEQGGESRKPFRLVTLREYAAVKEKVGASHTKKLAS